MENKMVIVPFEVEMAKKITNGEVDGKIVTRDGRNARIVCWDVKDKFRPILALIMDSEEEKDYTYFTDGMYYGKRENEKDLMLEIPEYMTFKDGNILYVRLNGGYWFVFIYSDKGKSKTHFYAAIDDDETLWIENNRITSNDDISELRFATESEKQKLIEALKASKEPKAKEYLKRFFDIEVKPECEFNPKDWVLIRDNYEDMWCLDIYSHKVWDKDEKCYHYYCVGGWSYQCIPYNEKTAHLLGTTKDYKGD